MGRMTAYDQNGRMLSNFDKSDYDFLIRYGRMPEEVMEENAKLRKELELSIRGTCCNVAGMEDVFECSVCGGRYVSWELRRWARYCPDCGRKVVDS